MKQTDADMPPHLPLPEPSLATPPSPPVGGPPLTDALRAAARLAHRLFDACDLLLHRGAPDSPLLLWTPGAARPRELPDPLARSLCAAVVAAGEPLAVARVQEDLRFRRDWGARGNAALSFAGVPLRVGSAGVLGVWAEGERGWSAGDLEALEELAQVIEAVAEPRIGGGPEAAPVRRIASCPIALLSLDREGRLLGANGFAAQVFCRPPEHLLGVALQDLTVPEDRDGAAAALEAVLSGRPGAEVELHVPRPTGERRLMHLTLGPTVEGGRVVEVQVVARDVTEERAREMQLRRAERMASVSPLLSGVCHELNNPLTSIKSFAELLLLDERPAEDREALEIMHREAHRAAKIVSDLRVVARQSREMAAVRGAADLNEVVRQVLHLRSESLAAGGIEVITELSPDLRPTWAVQSQLEQVVLQLISNAEQALQQIPRPRTLAIRTYPGDLGLALSVRDNGPGIAPEHVDRIFDPFWTTRQAGAGTGLGLSLVHSVISDHGGRVLVDGGLGQGACFVVELPTVEQPVGSLPESDGTGARRRLRILVVDDEAPIRFSLCRYMERRGHQVQEAAEGRAALRLLEGSTAEQQFDIIVADLRMPGLDGEQLFARLRERGDGYEQRLIFITGDAESPDAERVLRDAGVPVVWKPFELAEVAQIIEAQVGTLSGP